MKNKTFRLFISSTFSDFSLERALLQTSVFPKLEAYCASYGYQFQPIDLRWGVNEEAQLDQKTIEICLNEVNNCKHYPHPNFLIMLGNRYGWVPLPYVIERQDFENILHYYLDDIESQLFLKEWYQHDENHLMANESTAYVLKAREGEFVEYDHWVKIEDRLRESLQVAVNNLASIDNKYNYFLSATEHEVIRGIYSYTQQLNSFKAIKKREDAKCKLDMEYVYGFVREIETKRSISGNSIFFDKSQKLLNEFKSNLKKTLHSKKLLELKTIMNSSNSLEEDYLKIYEDWIFKFLKSSIKKQIYRISADSTKEISKSEHLAFKNMKLKVFVGQNEILNHIDYYIKEESQIPLIVYGKSGMGKSSLLAKAIDNIDLGSIDQLIFRFVGASDRSTSIRGLLISISREIDEEKSEALENLFDDDSFFNKVSEILSAINKKTIIFIDAIDQLVEKDYLKWLPEALPPHLKIVISVLQDEDYREDSSYLDLLEVKYNRELHPKHFIQIKALKRKDGNDILNLLLKQSNRAITSDQREYALYMFEKSGCSPLYLTIVFEEIKKWKSFVDITQLVLKDSVIKSIQSFIENLSKVYHHQQLLVCRTLGYLECAKNGLSEKEILDVLSADAEVIQMIENQFHQNLSRKIPIAPWARLYSQLSPFLIEKLSDHVSLISQFHRQFKNVVQSTILAEESERKKLHHSLGQYFKQQKLISSKGIYNLRKLSEQAYQFCKCEKIDELLELFEQNYIRIKYEKGKLYDCLFEIERAFIIAQEHPNAFNTNRIFSVMLKFLFDYSSEQGRLFDFELIHTYFVYRKSSQFYPEFLKAVSNKERIKLDISDESFLGDYYLIFLTSLVGFLRRGAQLKEAAATIEKIIQEHQLRQQSGKDNTSNIKQLSTSYYEWGYVSYLRGDFVAANRAFQRSIDYAIIIDNVIGEWITKCVKVRIAFLSGLGSIEEFDQVLDEAFEVFKNLESNNNAAKRWAMVTRHHKFEINYIKKDAKMMTKYYNYLRTHEWNLEYNVPMDLYKAQLAQVKGDYNASILYFKNYLNRFSLDQISEEEAISEVYYQMGLSFFEKGDIPSAKLTWEKALSLNDEPGNHIFKQKIMDSLKNIEQ